MLKQIIVVSCEVILFELCKRCKFVKIPRTGNIGPGTAMSKKYILYKTNQHNCPGLHIWTPKLIFEVKRLIYIYSIYIKGDFFPFKIPSILYTPVSQVWNREVHKCVWDSSEKSELRNLYCTVCIQERRKNQLLYYHRKAELVSAVY